MHERSTEISAGEDAQLHTIFSGKVCSVIIKAKEYDARDDITEPDSGSNCSNEKDAAVLEDDEDDPVVEKLTFFMNLLSEDAQIRRNTVASLWVAK
jgi:hypothetical protein